MSDQGIRLYDPTAATPALSVPLAPRLSSPVGTRPGILDNGKPNAGTLLRAVVDTLCQPHDRGDLVTGRMPIYAPVAPEVVEALASCSFVLVGSAD